jgi:hypothetical protein
MSGFRGWEMTELFPKRSHSDAHNDLRGKVQRFRRKLHEDCQEIKYIGVEVATTIVFLYWLIRTVYHELGF